MFSKLLEKLKGFEVYLAIIASLIAVYGFFEAKFTQNNPAVTVTKSSVEHLTMFPKADGFRAQFSFKDSVVKDLWKIRFAVENTGKAAIIGRGYQKSILDSTITLAIGQEYNLINTSLIQSSFPLKFYALDNELQFAFDQWRPGEFAVFEVYVDGSIQQNKVQPAVLLSDRQLLNGKTIYKELSYASIDKKVYLKDYMPNFAVVGMWWWYVLTSGLVIIAMPFAIVDEYKKRNRYNLWMLVYNSEYISEIQDLIDKGVIDKFYDPLSLSEERWEYFTTPRIFVKVKPSVKSIVMGAVIVVSVFIIPLLWMIKSF